MAAVSRIRTIDAIRGVAVLIMIPLHLLLFGGGTGWDLSGGGTLSPFPVDMVPPLGTGLILFFFITGMALAVTSVQKRGTQTVGRLSRGVVKRYGMYIFIGAAIQFLLIYLLQPAFGNSGSYQIPMDPVSILQYIFGGGFLTLAQPIIGLSIGAMIAFPFIYRLSWKQLAAAALALAVTVWGVLSLVSVPDFFLLNLFFTDAFAVFKGLTTIFFGAALGKLMMEGRALDRRYVVAALAVVGAYVAVPSLLNGQPLHLALAMWSYPHAIAFITALGVVSLSLFRHFDSTNAGFLAFTVLGRSSFAVYFGHFFLIIAIYAAFMMLGITASAGIVLAEMALSTSLIWGAAYYFSKRRWGAPSTW